MIKYMIYLAMVLLIFWSVFYVVKAVFRQWNGKHGCGGCGGCEGCHLECPNRKKKK